ncbi:MAG: D-alanine--D-alanine ligase [Spirochaetaceae bacterium]|nr:D-alanine--D-alanine ligase [Spirochaetaceae bacterium]
MNIAVIYGGRSGEHEVSIISATSIVRHLDRTKYQTTLIGISKEGRWFYQDPSQIDKIREEEDTLLEIQQEDRREVMVVPGGGSTSGIRVAGTGQVFVNIKVDLALIVLHGTYGEDGTIQGLFDMASIPYTGCGCLSSAITMDKEVTKAIWKNAGLPVLPHICLHSGDVEKTGWNTAKLQALVSSAERDFGYPLFVKPCSAGSSVGAAKATNFQQLVEALQEAFKWDYKVLIEPGLNPREIECSVTGNGADFSPIVGEEHLHEESLSVDELRAELQQSEPDVNKVRAYIPGEIAPSHQFYDYDAKYTDPNGAKLIIPADIKEEQQEKIRSLAIKAYKALDCTGLSRVDFFLEKDTGNLYLNEINTIPGFTSISMFPKMCQEAGLEYSELLDLIILQGLSRFQRRLSLQTSRS